MNRNEHDEFEELDELLGRLRDARLSEEDGERLESILASDPAARRYYVEYMDIRTALEHSLAADSERAAETIAARAVESGKKSRSHGVIRFAQLAAAVIFGAIVALVPVWYRDSLSSAHGYGGVAVLSESVDARWGEVAREPTIGGAITPGELELLEGVAMIDFYSGANVIVEAPARFELVSTEEVRITRGNARFRLPEQTSPFSINGKISKAAGKAAEFGISVRDGGEYELHILDGAIDWGSPPDRVRLIGGTGLKRSSDAASVPSTDITPDPRAFVSSSEFEARATASYAERFAAWEALSRELGNDERVLVYSPFRAIERLSRSLHNEAAVTTASDGAIVGCSWVSGRWPTKGALDFRRRSDRVRLEVPGVHDALSLAAWVRVDGLDRSYNSLLLTDGFETGEVHWQILRSGKIELSIAYDAEEDEDCITPTIITSEELGRWIHLAVVCDAENRIVTHYVDGVEVSRHELRRPVKPRIGAAEIGNWGVAKSGDRDPLRAFNGRMDELIVFRAAIGADEIRRIHEIGNPQ